MVRFIIEVEGSVFRLAPFRLLLAAIAFSVLSIPQLSAADGAVGVVSPPNPSFIVVGFTGGFVRHDNPHHGPVQLATRLRQQFSKEAYVRVFENRHRRSAFRTITRLLDTDHDGSLSPEEKTRAKVILFGHSWGASAVVLLSRELERAGVPVLLTVQVDSVAKPWQHDGVIPENVAAAVNFYQPYGFIHGRSEIRAEDDSRTQILGNYRFDYHRNPVQCEGIAWFDRTFMSNHMESECDPHLWNQVEGLVRDRLVPAQVVAVMPQP